MLNKNFKKISAVSSNLMSIFNDSEKFKKFLRSFDDYMFRLKHGGWNDREIYRLLRGEYNISKDDYKWFKNEMQKIDEKSMNDFLYNNDNTLLNRFKGDISNPSTETNESTTNPSTETNESTNINLKQVDGIKIKELLFKLKRIYFNWQSNKVNKTKLVQYFEEIFTALKKELVQYVIKIDQRPEIGFKFASKRKIAQQYQYLEDFDYKNIQSIAENIENILFTQGLTKENMKSVSDLMYQLNFYLGEMKNDVILGETDAKDITKRQVQGLVNNMGDLLENKDTEGATKILEKILKKFDLDLKTFVELLNSKEMITNPTFRSFVRWVGQKKNY